tara:strand:- start:18032 stop:18745 length:714 start_codon:yes stop_codon:yes gene_type:complete
MSDVTLSAGPPAVRRRPPLSTWSILAMVASLGVCPLVTILAFPLGMLGLRDVRSKAKSGRRLCWTAMIIAAVVTPLTAWFMVWWNGEVRVPLMNGPLAPIQAGMDGDMEGFNEGFAPSAVAATPDVEAGRFLATLRGDYGLLKSIRVDDTREPIFAPDGWSVRVPYVFEFQHGRVPGEARFVMLEPGPDGNRLVLRFSSVLVGDDPVVAWPPAAADEEREPLPVRGILEQETSEPDA